MSTLQYARKRAEGFECVKPYDNVFSNFRCIHKDSPPPGEIDCPLLSCAFAKRFNFGHVLAATCDNGRIIILNTEYKKDDIYPYNIQEVTTDALFSVAWSDMDMKLLTTSGSRSATLFDVRKDGSVTELDSFQAHTGTVKTACFKPHSSDVFATGARDGLIYVWDSRAKKSSSGAILHDQCIMNGHSRNDNNDQNAVLPITCLVFQDENRLISCADTDPNIKVWDLRKTYRTYMKKHVPVLQFSSLEKKTSAGYSNMVINKNGTRLFANCLDRTIYSYNITSYSANLENTYTGHHGDSFYVKCSLSPDEGYIASTDKLNKVYIWKINSSKDPVIMLDGIDEGLSGVSWCPVDELKLATTSDYPSPWIWSAWPEKKNEKNNIGFAKNLHTTHFPFRRCKRTSSITSKLPKFVDDRSELAKIVLPNAVEDGIYQIHTCAVIESKPNSLNNWLTNIHNQPAKESPTSKSENTTPKQIRKLSVRNRVSPKVEKSPNNRNPMKRLKRKRLDMSPGNDLTKYFKSFDENRHKV